MAQVKSGDTVKIHYTGSLDNGTEFDSSAGQEPLQFTVGTGQLIPGLDKAVEGMTVGEKKTVNVEPDEAYGPRQDQMVSEVPKSALPTHIEPEVGMGLQTKSQDGQDLQLTVTEVGEETITVDANHPLAGKPLNFEIELMQIG